MLILRHSTIGFLWAILLHWVDCIRVTHPLPKKHFAYLFLIDKIINFAIIYSFSMAKKKENIEEPLEKQLWKAADKLRKNIDAAEYKHVVLGLIFLKYISISFEELYAKLQKEIELGADPEDREEYKAGLVDCIVNLPAKLFLNTQIPASLWFLSLRKKTTSTLQNVLLH